jgi:hypothetical protein
VLHRAFFFELAHDARHGRGLLPDGDIDALRCYLNGLLNTEMSWVDLFQLNNSRKFMG